MIARYRAHPWPTAYSQCSESAYPHPADGMTRIDCVCALRDPLPLGHQSLLYIVHCRLQAIDRGTGSALPLPVIF